MPGAAWPARRRRSKQNLGSNQLPRPSKPGRGISWFFTDQNIALRPSRASRADWRAQVGQSVGYADKKPKEVTK